MTGLQRLSNGSMLMLSAGLLTAFEGALLAVWGSQPYVLNPHIRTPWCQRHRRRPVPPPAAGRGPARRERGGTIGQVALHLPQARLRSYQGIVAKTENWRTLGASAEEVAYLDGMEEDETDRDLSRAAELVAAAE